MDNPQVGNPHVGNPGVGSPQVANIDKYAAQLREMVQFERGLADDRVRMLLTLQGFLFAALGFSVGRDEYVALVLAVTGAVSTLALIRHVGASLGTIQGLLEAWERRRTPDYNGPPIVGEAEIRESKRTIQRLCTMFAGVWGAILMWRISQWWH